MRVEDKAVPIKSHCGPSLNEPSRTNSVWYEVASSDSGRGLLHDLVRQGLPALVQIIAGNRRGRALDQNQTQRIDKS